MPDNIPASIDVVEQAVQSGTLSMHRINMKCRKMLAAKYRAGLNRYAAVNAVGLLDDLNKPAFEALRYQLAEQALTLLCNDRDLLPLRRLDTLKIACLNVGQNASAPFTQHLQRYAAVESFSMTPAPPPDTLDKIRRQLQPYNLIIVGYHASDARPQYHFGVDSLAAAFIAELAARKPVVLDLFGTPYGLRKLVDSCRRFPAIIISYDDTKYAQERSAQLIFGGVAARGSLPVSIDDAWVFGNGVKQTAPTRLHYATPEETGLDRSQLAPVDALIADAIGRQATPGAQVMAIYKGTVFYHKTAGYHTYDSTAPPVQENDVYDWASITKIGATLPLVMRLADHGQLSTAATLGSYLPELAGANKHPLKIADLLTHTSGLQAFQPFQQTLFNNDGDSAGLPDARYFSRRQSPEYPLPVAAGLYASNDLPPLLYGLIDRSPLLRKTYRYSDWGFIYLQRTLERLAGESIDKLAERLFYAPLGMYNTGYNPLQRIAPTRIPPTEIDRLFRRGVVHGTVHDPTAALLGGVAGHAGVFGNANDLAKLLQLYLNGGSYGGERYLSDSIIQRFAACAMCDKGVRRGLGFDKPEPRPDKPSPVGREWSLDSYGHSGYTGTLCWIDPQRDLIVVFLSNRTYPDDDNKLGRMNTRSLIFSHFATLIDRLENDR